MAEQMASPEREKLGGDEINTSAELAESAATTLFFDQGHISELMPAVERSRDPSKVVGTAIGQIALLAYNKLNQADLGVDDRVWASDGGVIDNLLDEVLEFFNEAGIQLDPQATAQAIVGVLKDSPVAQGPQPASAPMGGAPANMAAPVQGAMQ